MESVKKSDVTSQKTDEVCPTCKEGHLVIRLGKYGRFKGCSTYPKCKHIENIDSEGNTVAPQAKEPPKETGVTCPKCAKHPIVEKKSRHGKVFYGCAGYPKCDYAVWNMPVNEACPNPNCGSPILTIKTTKEGDFKLCPNCGWHDEALPPRYRPRKKKEA